MTMLSASRRLESVLLVTMPRRSTVSAAGSRPIKEEGVRVKAEKVKQEKVNGKRRAQTPQVEREPSEQAEDQPKEEEDEEDGSQQNDAEDYNERVNGTPRGNKRRRVNGGGQSAVDDESGSQPGPSLPQVKTLPRGEDGQV
jgi:hypothetical protein